MVIVDERRIELTGILEKISEEEVKAREEAVQIVEDARKEAEQILRKAREDALKEAKSVVSSIEKNTEAEISKIEQEFAKRKEELRASRKKNEKKAVDAVLGLLMK